MAGIIAALALAVALTCVLIQAYAAAGRARLAADLAALGGATAGTSWHTASDPCAVAAEVAAANGGELAGCQILGEDVQVQVSVPAGSFLPGRYAVATARAGPAG